MRKASITSTTTTRRSLVGAESPPRYALRHRFSNPWAFGNGTGEREDSLGMKEWCRLIDKWRWRSQEDAKDRRRYEEQRQREEDSDDEERKVVDEKDAEGIVRDTRDVLKGLYQLYFFFAARKLYELGWIKRKGEGGLQHTPQVVTFEQKSHSDQENDNALHFSLLMVVHIEASRRHVEHILRYNRVVLQGGLFALSAQSAPSSVLYVNQSAGVQRDIHARFVQRRNLSPYLLHGPREVSMATVYARKLVYPDHSVRTMMSKRTEQQGQTPTQTSQSALPRVISLLPAFSITLDNLRVSHNKIVTIEKIGTDERASGSGWVLCPVGSDELTTMAVRVVFLTFHNARALLQEEGEERVRERLISGFREDMVQFKHSCETEE